MPRSFERSDDQLDSLPLTDLSTGLSDAPENSQNCPAPQQDEPIEIPLTEDSIVISHIIEPPRPPRSLRFFFLPLDFLFPGGFRSSWLSVFHCLLMIFLVTSWAFGVSGCGPKRIVESPQCQEKTVQQYLGSLESLEPIVVMGKNSVLCASDGSRECLMNALFQPSSDPQVNNAIVLQAVAFNSKIREAATGARVLTAIGVALGFLGNSYHHSTLWLGLSCPTILAAIVLSTRDLSYCVPTVYSNSFTPSAAQATSYVGAPRQFCLNVNGRPFTPARTENFPEARQPTSSEVCEVAAANLCEENRWFFLSLMIPPFLYALLWLSLMAQYGTLMINYQWLHRRAFSFSSIRSSRLELDNSNFPSSTASYVLTLMNSLLYFLLTAPFSMVSGCFFQRSLDWPWLLQLADANFYCWWDSLDSFKRQFIAELRISSDRGDRIEALQHSLELAISSGRSIISRSISHGYSIEEAMTALPAMDKAGKSMPTKILLSIALSLSVITITASVLFLSAELGLSIALESPILPSFVSSSAYWIHAIIILSTVVPVIFSYFMIFLAVFLYRIENSIFQRTLKGWAIGPANDDEAAENPLRLSTEELKVWNRVLLSETIFQASSPASFIFGYCLSAVLAFACHVLTTAYLASIIAVVVLWNPSQILRWAAVFTFVPLVHWALVRFGLRRFLLCCSNLPAALIWFDVFSLLISLLTAPLRSFLRVFFGSFSFLFSLYRFDSSALPVGLPRSFLFLDAINAAFHRIILWQANGQSLEELKRSS